jgi:hypothetical protein
MWDFDQGVGVERDAGEGLVLAAWGALTRDRCVRAIKQWRFCRVLCPSRVVVVGLIALVTTLVAQCLLVGPGEVSMLLSVSLS